MRKVLVSACLMGERVRYDGGASELGSRLLERWKHEGRLVMICPEMAGGLPVPRPAAEISGGGGLAVLEGAAQVVTARGIDVTAHFVRGAERALALARSHDVALAILKARSPSCGVLQIYDGSHSGTLHAGAGVTAALLQKHGIAVYNDESLSAAAIELARVEAL